MANNTKEPYLFTKFIEIMEVLYPVLMAWGFARAVQYFDLKWVNGIPKIDWAYTLPLFIATYVLIRFFFAPVHNLRKIAMETMYRNIAQRFVFFWDILMLIGHSFIFYLMCFTLSNRENLAYFYYLFISLLFLNVIWLGSIILREFIWGEESFRQHRCWTINNLSHLIAFCILLILNYFSIINIYSKPYYWWLFLLALSNCSFDFIAAAPCYLGFDKVKKK